MTPLVCDALAMPWALVGTAFGIPVGYWIAHTEARISRRHFRSISGTEGDQHDQH